MARKRRDVDAGRVVEELFRIPPLQEEDLRTRLEGVDAREACRLLADMVERDQLHTSGARDLVAAALCVLGLGDEADRLEQLVLRASLSPRARSVAMEALSRSRPDILSLVVARLGPEESARVSLAPLLDTVLSIQAEPELGASVADFLEWAAPEIRPRLVVEIETHRRHVGTSPVLVYRYALGRPALKDVRPALLAAVLEEGGHASLDVLEEIRAEATCPEARRDLQAALLRLRTRTVVEGRDCPPPRGEAHVSTCDGQGAFVVFAVFENPDGHLTVANLCIRAAGDVRGGFVNVEQHPEDVTQLLAGMEGQAGTHYARVPLGVAAALSHEAMVRTRDAGLKLPVDASQSVFLLERVLPVEEGVLEATTGGEDVDRGVVLDVLEAHPALDTWFFDLADLEQGGVHPPGPGMTEEDWVEQAADRLDQPVLRGRLVGMARHMARWHHWRGERGPALAFSVMARQCEADFPHSALVRFLLQRTVAFLGEAPLASEAPPLFDPAVRRHLKGAFFADVKHPTALDLATLDFTEVAALALDRALAHVPGECHPRADELETLAHQVAKLVAGALARQDHAGAEALVTGEVARRLAETCRLDEETARWLGAEVAAGVISFTQEVCVSCPLACMDKPHAGARDAFHAPGHPALALLPENAPSRCGGPGSGKAGKRRARG